MTVAVPESYFDSFHTPKYRSRNPVQRHLIRRFVGELAGLFDRTEPGSSVLELGCGEGFVAGQLSTRRPLDAYVGVDLDGDDLQHLREKFPHVETHRASIYDLSFLDRTFDVVVCAEVLEHLDRPDAAIEQMLSFSPRWLLLSVPHEPWFRLSNLARGKNVRRLGNDEDHVNLWGKRGFAKLLSPYLDIETHLVRYPWQIVLASPK